MISAQLQSQAPLILSRPLLSQAFQKQCQDLSNRQTSSIVITLCSPGSKRRGAKSNMQITAASKRPFGYPWGRRFVEVLPYAGLLFALFTGCVRTHPNQEEVLQSGHSVFSFMLLPRKSKGHECGRYKGGVVVRAI
jgi:hypothetical protein